jgi:hypothetical protein
VNLLQARCTLLRDGFERDENLKSPVNTQGSLVDIDKEERNINIIYTCNTKDEEILLQTSIKELLILTD